MEDGKEEKRERTQRNGCTHAYVYPYKGMRTTAVKQPGFATYVHLSTLLRENDGKEKRS
jgi:hypothetical protein